MRDCLAVYAGSFDPLTVGHLWVVEQRAELFDRLIVAVGVDPGKAGLFTVESYTPAPVFERIVRAVHAKRA
jgi:cytidyltransferase-like protein